MGSNTDKSNILTNGENLIIITVLKHIMSSEAEADIEQCSLIQNKGQYFTKH
jgi:hypothetical protein